MVKKLFSFIMFVLIGVTTLQAENTAYAYYSNNTLTFRYGEIPANSIQVFVSRFISEICVLNGRKVMGRILQR